jgi:hypothetical protein
VAIIREYENRIKILGILNYLILIITNEIEERVEINFENINKI